MQAVLFQVLLHVRLHAARQYRPRGRGADAGARHGFYDCLPGVPRQRPHHLQGQPVRRRRAAGRIWHARPSLDADDGFESGTRAAAAGASQGRPGRFLRGGEGRRRYRPALHGLAWPGLPFRRRRCRLEPRPGSHRRRLRGLETDHGRLRHRPGTATEFPPAGPVGAIACGPGGAFAPTDGLACRDLGQLLRGHAAAGGALARTGAIVPRRPFAAAAGGGWSTPSWSKPWPGPARTWRKARC